MTQCIVARAIQCLPPADVGQTEGASDSLNDIKHLLHYTAHGSRTRATGGRRMRRQKIRHANNGKRATNFLGTSLLHDDVKRGVRRGVTVAFHRIEPAFLLYLALLLLCRSYQCTMSGDGDVFQGKVPSSHQF